MASTSTGFTERHWYNPPRVILKRVSISADPEERLTCRVSIEPEMADFDLFYEGAPVADLDARADAFVLPALFRAAATEADLLVQAPVSERLAANLSDIGFILSVLLGKTRGPQIELEDVARERDCASGAVTGFSAGIDSFFTLKQKFFDYQGDMRVTHLVHNDVGANTTVEKKEAQLMHTRALSEMMGLPLFSVRSNIAEFMPRSFKQSHTVRNASVAHLLAGEVSNFYYSSSDNYQHVAISPTDAMGQADPVLLPLFSTGAMNMASVGSTHSRLEKTLELADHPIVRENLDVCATRLSWPEIQLRRLLEMHAD